MPPDFSPSSGWGRSIQSTSLRAVDSIEEMQEKLVNLEGHRGALPIGLQRSYGDSALNSGGVQFSTEKLQEWNLDRETGEIRVGAGVSIRQLESIALDQGFFPAIVPGTGFVTIGGAIAADIHGKSHHKTGSFSSIVKSMQVLYSDGVIRELYPDGPTSAHFWATVAGMGLTGIIVNAELQLKRISGNYFDVRESRCADLSILLAELRSADSEYDHTVAWVDLSGEFRGRGVVGMGNFATDRDEKFGLKSRSINIPITFNKSLITPLTVKSFNSFWYHKPLKSGKLSINAFTHPLDGIGSWNRVYGKRGFLQYQFSIPDGHEDFLFTVLSKLREIKGASFLGVLKRFGSASRAPLSFPSPGWTLALDFPIGIPRLEATLTEFDQELCQRGGRIYLVKDSRLKPDFLPKMYQRSEEWKTVRAQMDPGNKWKSDQGRRLGLC